MATKNNEAMAMIFNYCYIIGWLMGLFCADFYGILPNFSIP